MKNGRLIFLASIMLMLSFPAMAQTMDHPGILTKAWGWVTGNLYQVTAGIVVGIMAKHGWSQAVKAFAHKSAGISKEIGEAFLSGSKFLDVLDDSIKEDGTLKENSVQELIQSGREVIAEAKDVVISIKPKQ